MSVDVTDSPDLTTRDFVQRRYDAAGTDLWATSGNVIVSTADLTSASFRSLQ